MDNPQIYSIAQDDKVHDICQTSNTLIINVGPNRVKLYDKRNLKESLEMFTMNFNINCLNNYQEKNFLVGSIEGKISVERLVPGSNYSFKCHRIESEDEIVAYPVNCVEAHPNMEIFVSGGSDGLVYFWDFDKKKKIRKSKEYAGR